MWNIRRFYNQNRKSIWIILLIIFFLILILQLINYFVGKNVEKKFVATENVIIDNSVNSTSSTTIKSNKSTVSGNKVSTDSLQIAKETIEEFLNYCNKGKDEEAYKMLTEECKEEMYRSIRLFQENYSSKIPKNEEINCTIENWTDNIYKVTIEGDILLTGKVEDKNLTDYITIEKCDDKYQLNINSYIGRLELNKSNYQEDVRLTVLSRDVYMDYEKYTIKIENKSKSDILLDTKQDMKSMYITDKSRAKYSSYSHELTDADLTVTKNHTKTISIKYYSSYNSNKKINGLIFSKVIMDYNSNTKITNSLNVKKIGVNM